MAQLALRSIKGEITNLNVAKDQFTTFYVGYGSAPSDDYDGLTRNTAFATIQHAIDEADTGSKIYVNDITYAENVTIDKENIHLIGEKPNTTIINPSSGTGLTISAGRVKCENFKVYGNTAATGAIVVEEDLCHLDSIYIEGVDGAYGLHIDGPLIAMFERIFMASIYLSRGIFAETGSYLEIQTCFLTTLKAAGTAIYIDDIDAIRIHDNEIKNNPNGIYLSSNAENCSIYHNNLITNTVQVKDDGATNNWWENYYSDHTTDTNNNGLCDTAYPFTTGNDYSPVSKRSGWLQQSLGFASLT